MSEKVLEASILGWPSFHIFCLWDGTPRGFHIENLEKILSFIALAGGGAE